MATTTTNHKLTNAVGAVLANSAKVEWPDGVTRGDL